MSFIWIFHEANLQCNIQSLQCSDLVKVSFTKVLQIKTRMKKHKTNRHPSTFNHKKIHSFFINLQLYLFDKSTSSWLEKGRGQLRLNDLRNLSSNGNEDASNSPSSRLIMRTAGSLRVILNAKVFPEMTVEKPTEKNVRLTAMDEQVS